MLKRICLQEKLKPSCLRGGVVVKTSEIFISKIDISVLNRMVQADRTDCVLLYYLQGVHWEPALGGTMLNAWPTVRNSHKWLRVVAPQRTLCKGGNYQESRHVCSQSCPVVYLLQHIAQVMEIPEICFQSNVFLTTKHSPFAAENWDCI